MTTTNRVALVTGSRRGIGRAIALTLARDGFDIVINDYALDHLAEQTAADIRALGRQAHLIAADLGNNLDQGIGTRHGRALWPAGCVGQQRGQLGMGRCAGHSRSALGQDVGG